MTAADTIVPLLATSLVASVPFLLPALGETFGELSGVLNIGLEGILLISAFSSYAVAIEYQNLVLAVFAGIMAGLGTSLLMVALCVRLPLNQIVVGFAISILGLGLSSFLNDAKLLRGGLLEAVNGFPQLCIPGACDIPVIGRILFNQNILTYVALVLVPLAYFFLFRTTTGLRIRAVGENPAAARSDGINVRLTRSLCVVAGGALTGLGGAFLTVGYVNFFTDGMTSGTGWIALAIVIVGGWNPVGVLLGSYLFGLSESIALDIQAMGVSVPASLTGLLPYILTIVILMLAGSRARRRAPASLGKPFLEEEH